ncbi:hypothetical protein O3M35_008241 [Rhynocoris fuscipes]|uniref:Zinc finger ZPR1-type domain-containing protein n=1 Tax=Rhynocoris fuscipes TaxID=488301 RepID=A0AAW1DCL5_9HEMI
MTSNSKESESQSKKPLFRPLDAEDKEPEITEIESLCMSCERNGTTRLLLTRIPYYKEVVLMSFECPHCGYSNNEIQPGGEIQEKGVKITLELTTKDDINRQLVKSDFTSIKIPHLQFEIPAQSQKGEITTVEGVITRAIDGLKHEQPLRKVLDSELAKKIFSLIKQLRKLDGSTPFTMILEDISGNTFVENPQAPSADPNCKTEYFERTKEEDHKLGIFTHQEVLGDDDTSGKKSEVEDLVEKTEDLDLAGEVLTFNTNCPNCGSPCDTNMKVIDIPHFKEVVIMATTCDYCGLRTNEVKSAGGVEPQGIRIELSIREKKDFSRDILKSETCNLEIPELELEGGPHILCGKFTTVEGLLQDIEKGLDGSGANLFNVFGDSRRGKRIDKVLSGLADIISGKMAATLVLNDPAGNSYIQSLSDDGPDSALKVIRYDRSYEQNEELGLNDMKTENYEEN